jgi:hypothetical protein
VDSLFKSPEINELDRLAVPPPHPRGEMYFSAQDFAPVPPVSDDSSEDSEENASKETWGAGDGWVEDADGNVLPDQAPEAPSPSRRSARAPLPYNQTRKK